MTTNILIKKAIVVDTESQHNGKTVDILIENGKFTKISANISSNHPTFEAENLHISQGWIDMKTNFCDPGFEFKEDINSGLNAAQKGGFTGVVTMPSTLPATDSKTGIDYMLNAAKHHTVDLFPAGAISKALKGENITEMFDMQQAGAIAFTDNKNSIQNAELLKTALLYCKSFNGLIIHYPNDTTIAANGQVNECKTSTLNGLKGIPALAEELMVARDLFLAEYCDTRIHLSCISTAKSVDLIQKAKAKNIKVTCDVAAANLLLDDSMISGFDSNYKTLPPLRSKKDISALIKGLKNGVIDCVVSDHTPQNIEEKKKEFDLSSFGMIGLETTYATLNESLNKNHSNQLITSFISIKARNILDLKTTPLKEGNKTNITLFNPTKKWTLSKTDIVSKSKNTPFINFEFTGKSLATYNNSIFKKC